VKAKLQLCLTFGLREVSDQVHDLAVVSVAKESPVPVVRKVDLPHSGSGRCAEEKIFAPTGIRSSDHRSPVLHPVT
jgi:hypothetical protein